VEIIEEILLFDAVLAEQVRLRTRSHVLEEALALAADRTLQKLVARLGLLKSQLPGLLDGFEMILDTCLFVDVRQLLEKVQMLPLWLLVLV